MLRDFKNSSQDPDFTQVRNDSVFWLLALCPVLFYCDNCFSQKLRDSQGIPYPLIWSAQLFYFKAQWNKSPGSSGVKTWVQVQIGSQLTSRRWRFCSLFHGALRSPARLKGALKCSYGDNVDVVCVRLVCSFTLFLFSQLFYCVNQDPYKPCVVTTEHTSNFLCKKIKILLCVQETQEYSWFSLL